MNVTVDVYDVLKAFNVVNPATQHAVKKLLCTGVRGHKDALTDLEESLESIKRAIELEDPFTIQNVRRKIEREGP